jgi:hypothetical protein
MSIAHLTQVRFFLSVDTAGRGIFSGKLRMPCINLMQGMLYNKSGRGENEVFPFAQENQGDYRDLDIGRNETGKNTDSCKRQAIYGQTYQVFQLPLAFDTFNGFRSCSAESLNFLLQER